MLPWIGELGSCTCVGSYNFSIRWNNLLLAAVGIKFPGIEYDIQKEEAGYRKELVHGEDDGIRADPKQLDNYMIE